MRFLISYRKNKINKIAQILGQIGELFCLCNKVIIMTPTRVNLARPNFVILYHCTTIKGENVDDYIPYLWNMHQTNTYWTIISRLMFSAEGNTTRLFTGVLYHSNDFFLFWFWLQKYTLGIRRKLSLESLEGV